MSVKNEGRNGRKSPAHELLRDVSPIFVFCAHGCIHFFCSDPQFVEDDLIRYRIGLIVITVHLATLVPVVPDGERNRVYYFYFSSGRFPRQV